MDWQHKSPNCFFAIGLVQTRKVTKVQEFREQARLAQKDRAQPGCAKGQVSGMYWFLVVPDISRKPQTTITFALAHLRALAWLGGGGWNILAVVINSLQNHELVSAEPTETNGFGWGLLQSSTQKGYGAPTTRLAAHMLQAP